ncbi:MAG TPA: transposase [Chthoniobacterales bacterium]|nr:transposase [Chthoniobacterales bacterium]
MPRQPRIEYEGAIYHVMNRGAHGEAIVREDADRELWIKTLAEACGKCQWRVNAYCLMSDHFHLVVETPLGNLVSGMKWFLGTYTVRFHARHRLRGHLFAGRYKSVVVDDSDDSYLRVACDYVHLNPARAGLLSAKQPLSDYAWSSYRDYLQRGLARPRWLRTDRLLGEQGVRRDDRRLRLEFSRRMEARRLEVDQARASDDLLPRGWRLGGEAFSARLLDRLGGKLTENHRAREPADTAEMKGERIIRSRLEEIGWSETDLQERGKCALEKIRIAQQLRAETTLSLKRVAERLNMGTWTNVSSLLYKVRKP